jgi:hypothetical protein
VGLALKRHIPAGDVGRLGCDDLQLLRGGSAKNAIDTSRISWSVTSETPCPEMTRNPYCSQAEPISRAVARRSSARSLRVNDEQSTTGTAFCVFGRHHHSYVAVVERVDREISTPDAGRRGAVDEEQARRAVGQVRPAMGPGRAAAGTPVRWPPPAAGCRRRTRSGCARR